MASVELRHWELEMQPVPFAVSGTGRGAHRRRETAEPESERSSLRRSSYPNAIPPQDPLGCRGGESAATRSFRPIFLVIVAHSSFRHLLGCGNDPQLPF